MKNTAFIIIIAILVILSLGYIIRFQEGHSGGGGGGHAGGGGHHGGGHGVRGGYYGGGGAVEVNPLLLDEYIYTDGYYLYDTPYIYRPYVLWSWY